MRTRSLVKPVVPVIRDEWSRFTYLPELAARLPEVAGAPVGVYHLTNEGTVSWYGFAARADPERGPGGGRTVPAAGRAAPLRGPAEHETPAHAALAGGVIRLYTCRTRNVIR